MMRKNQYLKSDRDDRGKKYRKDLTGTLKFIIFVDAIILVAAIIVAVCGG